VTPDEARRVARTFLTSVRLGGDPLAERDARRRALSVADLADRFMREHIEVKRRGRPPVSVGRGSALKGRTVAPKYRGPNGETWASRGAMPRWLSALIKEGHSVEEFLIGVGGKRKPAAAKKKIVKKKDAKGARKPRAERERDQGRSYGRLSG